MSRTIEEHCALISIYLDASRNGTAQARPEILQRMRSLGQRIARSGNQRLHEAYRRHATLISLALKDPRIEEDIVLSEDFFPRNGIPAHDSFFAPRAALAGVGGFNEKYFEVFRSGQASHQ